MLVTIAHRYRGPTASANGGYACGLLAGFVDGPAEVTLRLPPPLDRPLTVEQLRPDRAQLKDGDALVAEARSVDLDLEVPTAPAWEAAAGLTRGVTLGWGGDAFAECFVCGHRDDGSGLEIHARPVGASGLVAAAWIAAEVSPEIVWAAIDCPGAYAVGDPGRGEPLLGRMTARLERLPVEGERCVVIGWPLGNDGRKLYAGTALIGEDGQVVACSRQVWIEPRRV